MRTAKRRLVIWCIQMCLALLLGAVCGAAYSIYTHPHGIPSTPIPSGWGAIQPSNVGYCQEMECPI